jgi:hypothetical protein
MISVMWENPSIFRMNRVFAVFDIPSKVRKDHSICETITLKVTEEVLRTYT